MEVDERLRWLEARISSSLRPRGDELRTLFSDEENRAAFLAFCNHSESRRLFVHVPECGEGTIRVSAKPPRELSEKSLFFLKCSHTSKLTRESIAEDVVYSECSRLPLQHLELVMREVYLPLLSMHDASHAVSWDKLVDLLHRLVATMQVTQGFTQGQVVLPLPSIAVLAEAAASADHRSAVIHILESSVVAWMKQVKLALHFDPNSSILKAHGKYAGPLAEIEFWSTRLSQLESVRGQLNSVIVLNILHNLEQAHSTYAQAFIHVHRDIGKAVVDTELCLMYLNALKPWLLRLNQAYAPDTLVKAFPPLMMTLLLIWQYSGVYSYGVHFHRLLRLLSNEVMLKARDIVGQDLLSCPEESLVSLKLALRVCAAFRGCYLDFKEKAEVVGRTQRETAQPEATSGSVFLPFSTSSLHPKNTTWSDPWGHRETKFAPWPPRNSLVFAPLNGIMERCNDLVELVQTVQDFRELEAVAQGNGEASADPLVADIHSEFTACMQIFHQDDKDLLSLEPECQFEQQFFQFRSRVRGLEGRLSSALCSTFDLCPSLPAGLRVMEMFQGISRREALQTSLHERTQTIVTKMIEEVDAVSRTLSLHTPHPPSHTHTPPTASKLLWLHALRERVSEPMEKLREMAPHLLEGDLGWRLRQSYGELIRNIESQTAETKNSWTRNIPLGLTKTLKDNVLSRTPEGRLVVNLDPSLREVLQEAHYLTRPPLNVKPPPALRQLLRSVESAGLRERHTTLESVVQAYNDLQESLSEEDRLLFQCKLLLVEKLLSTGLDHLDWTSSDFPDFIAKARAAIWGDLREAINTVHEHTAAIRTIAESWSRVPGLDMFSEGEERVLEQLQKKHSRLLESLCYCLPPAVEKINSLLQRTLQCVEVSQESPAWSAYLTLVDSLVVGGLKHMVLTALSTLVHRAQQYEQGALIPPLVTVSVELSGNDVQFSPPLSPLSPLPSIPEVVHQWMEGFVGVAKLARRLLPGAEESCHGAISSDPDIQSVIGKICAHIETNARQCQSLRKRFTIYSFLWEQDVQAIFQDFLRGQAAPHPRRFTRPETVRSRASARVQSGRPRSSSQQTPSSPPPPETTLLGVMGVSDWDFLRPPGDHTPSPEEEDTSKRPSLDDFDGEIAVFQGILDRLERVEAVASVGWLSVDQRPAKHTLSSLTAKWKYVYASHLERQVVHVLSSLEQFFSETEPEVEGISGEESDTHTFMRLMSIFNRVNAQQVEMDTKFGAVHRAVLILDKFGHPLPPLARDQFNNAPLRWSNLKKRVALGKQRIGPRIQANGETISNDLSKFGATFTSLHEEFYSSQCLSHACLREEAQQMMEEFSRRLGVLQSQARDLIELQELLETSVFNFSLLQEFEEELSTLHDVWTIAESVLGVQGEWKTHNWQEIDCSELLVASEKQLQLVCSVVQLAHNWDVYLHTVEAIEVVRVTLPMVEGLRSHAMRPRHWKQVLRCAASPSHTHLVGRGGSFDPTLLLELTFGQLLELGLDEHSLEVHAIVERADKEIAIESLLNTFEEVWLSRQLELHPHRRGMGVTRPESVSGLGLSADHSSGTPKPRTPSARVTSAVRKRHSQAAGGRMSALSGTPSGSVEAHPPAVMLLCNSGGIFETLESHQISLQSVLGTAAAASFTDDLARWHKQLQTMEAVLGVWLQIQRLWVQLEEVYSSGEVHQHLPAHAYTFSTVDKEWRELMASTRGNPSVMTVCLKEGLLPSLEKLHSSLQQCQAALVQYVEGQRRRCPWFYFLTLEDILQFVCYGSNLQQLGSHITKLLPHASRLIFDYALPTMSGETPSHISRGGASKITGILSQLGERMDLTQAIVCEGPVENILNQLFSSLTTTLHGQLSHAVTKLILKNDSTQIQLPTLESLPAVWSSPLTIQIVLLATQIALELCLSKVVQKSANECKIHLHELSKEIHNLVNTATQILQGNPPAVEKLPEGRQVSILPPLASESQLLLDSNVALKASASNIQAEDSELSSSVLEDERSFQPRARGLLSRDQINKLQNVLILLSSFSHKIHNLSNQLRDTSTEVANSFAWQSLLHFDWSAADHSCVLSTLNASLPYGFHYSGSCARLVLTPALDKSLVFLLQAVRQKSNTMLVGKAGAGRNGLVHELAVMAGHPLLSLECSADVAHSTVVNCIKGMTTTGAWLFLHNVVYLLPAVIQAACNLLLEVQRARQNEASSIQWFSDNIRINYEHHSACFATAVLPPKGARLPNVLLEAFRSCNILYPERKPIVEALFTAHEFKNCHHLTKLLTTFCKAADELLSQNFVTFFEAKEAQGGSWKEKGSSPLCTGHLKFLVSAAQKHMREFEALGVLQDANPLHVPSGVFSEFSESTKASLKFRSVIVQKGEMPESPTQQQALLRQSLEEFALILAIKDCLLPSFPPTSKEHSILAQLLADVIPSCDIHGLLAHENAVREGMAARALKDRGAVESARESRATSAMQMVEEGHQQPSEDATSLEENTVHCCLLHQFTPTPLFQLAVAQLLSLVQSHTVVALHGPSCSGKTSCIQVAAETMREVHGGTVTCVTLACNAMREEELFGYQHKEDNRWCDGLLPQLLTKPTSGDSARPATRWFILDGQLSGSQLDTLLSFLSPDSTLKLSNGKTISLDPSVRFILELPSLSTLTPSSAVKIASLCLSPDTITWRDVVQRWLTDQDKAFADPVQSLFNKYIPKCLDFLSPLLARESHSSSNNMVSSVSLPSLVQNRLLPQELCPSEINLISTCYTIFQGMLSSSPDLSPLEMERCFIYAIVWSLGGFLTHENKTIFDAWWRKTFSQNEHLVFPDRGLLWDYFIKPGFQGFLPWSEHVPHYASPSYTYSAPFVHTTQSVAVNHLVKLLMDRGYPVLLNGSIGSGKTSVLLQLLKSYCARGITDTSLLHIYANQFTTAASVWNQLRDNLEWNWGRNYTPKGCKKLVCFIDDLHNVQTPGSPRPPSVCELVHHQLSTGGVYDPQSGKWHSVSNVCYLCTTSPGCSRQQLQPKFLKHFALLHWDEYGPDTLLHIFTTVLRSHFSAGNQRPTPTLTANQSDSSTTPHLIQRLVQTAVQVYEKLRGMFLPTPERLHYIFTLRHIAAIFRHLCLGLGRGSSSRDLLLLWQQESWWEYGGALSSEVDRERYWEVNCHALRKFFSQEEVLPLLLSEDCTRLSSLTSAELKAKFYHEMQEYNTSHPPLHVDLYKSTLEEVWHLSHMFTSPHDLSHTFLLHHAHPAPLVELAALHSGFTVVQPSHCFSPGLLSGSCDSRGMSERSYGVEQFRRDLTMVYTNVGVKGEKLVLLLNSTELLHEAFLVRLYEFVKDCAISSLFSPEDQSQIVNAIRSDVTQAGLTFSEETAWRFFIDRVRSNLRVVVAVPSLEEAMRSGCEGWRELMNTVGVHCHLPWERRQLVDVALHHLSSGCAFLPEGVSESSAYLLASIHLLLRTSRDLPPPSNSTYQYFVQRFVHQLRSVHSVKEEKCGQLSSALKCVGRAEERVVQLQERLHRERRVLEEKTEACMKLLSQIGQDTAISKEHSKLVGKQKGRIAHLKKVIPEYEHACELAIEEKERVIGESRKLVGSLDLQSLSELRALQKPPQEMEELLSAVIMIVKSPSADLSWTKGAKRLMANLDRFQELLLEFSEREDNSETILEALDPLLEKPSLSPDQLSRHPTGGTVASQLCSWVHGVVRLHTTLQTKLRPLEVKVTTMKASLSEYTEKLRQQDNKVEVLQERLMGLSASLESASVEKSRQQQQVNSMTKELQETQDFIAALSGTHEQWQSELDATNCTVTQMIGGLALTVSLAVYMSSAPPHTQMNIVNNHLKPVLEERGIELKWKDSNSLIDTCSVKAESKKTTASSNTSLDSADEDKTEDESHYNRLCTSMLPLLLPETFINSWLAKGCGLPQLLQIGLVVSSWNKWPLVYDPEGFAATWLKEYRKEELLVLDATDRSQKFFLSLEQALLNGQPVLLENMPSRLDPALQPLIELAHSWDGHTGEKVIRFCGRKLHVHPSFHLYMTTTSAPQEVPTALATDTTIINFSVSLPLAQELILDTAFHMFFGRQNEECGETCQKIAECRERLTSVEGEVFEKLQAQGLEDNYWWSAEKIGQLITTMKELDGELGNHLEKLHQLTATKSLLLPVARHGAVAHCLLRQLGRLKHYYQTSWETFSEMITSALHQYVEQNPDITQRISNLEETAVDGAINEIVAAVNKYILHSTLSLLAPRDWFTLATALSLLTYCNLQCSPALLIEQLLYLTQGERFLQELDLSGDTSSQFPPNPACISEDFWQTLHKIPLSTEYFSAMMQSVHTNPDFWEKLQGETTREISLFPWRKDGDPITLNDFVFLNCISRDTAIEKLLEHTPQLLEPLSIPTLANICGASKRKAIIFLHDGDSLISQANLWHLEAELKRILQGKSLQVLRFGAGFEETASELLTQPSSDCLLVTDVHLASPEWLKLLHWRVKQTLSTGCLLMLTANAKSQLLPVDLVRGSQVVPLSNVSMTATRNIPKAVFLSEEQNFYHLLQFTLSVIPNALLSQCSTLPEDLRAIAFNLPALHTMLHVSKNSSAPLGLHFCNLLAAVSHVITSVERSTKPTSAPEILSSLQLYVRDIFSPWCPGNNLDHLIEAYLSPEAVTPGARITVDSVKLIVPETTVAPKLYVEHVAGLMEADSGSQSNMFIMPDHFNESVEKLLLPVLGTLPGSFEDLATPLSPTAHSADVTPFSPSHVDSSRIRDTLEYCMERLPKMIHPTDIRPDAVGMKEWIGTCAAVCSQLPSAEQYQAYVLQKATTQYNSNLAAIGRDIEVLTDYASVGFDSLPPSLVPVLECLWRGEMPAQWSCTAHSDPVPLEEGYEGIHKAGLMLQGQVEQSSIDLTAKPVSGGPSEPLISGDSDPQQDSSLPTQTETETTLPSTVSGDSAQSQQQDSSSLTATLSGDSTQEKDSSGPTQADTNLSSGQQDTSGPTQADTNLSSGDSTQEKDSSGPTQVDTNLSSGQQDTSGPTQADTNLSSGDSTQEKDSSGPTQADTNLSSGNSTQEKGSSGTTQTDAATGVRM